MAIASFQELCAGFCEIAGVPTPTLTADERGIAAFHVKLRDVTINLLHFPEKSAQHAFILFEYGPLPDDREKAREVMRALLDANYSSLQVYPPRFSLSPNASAAIMQYVYPFFDATPIGLFELVNKGVEQALQWRQSFFLKDAPASQQAPAFQANMMFSDFA